MPTWKEFKCRIEIEGKEAKEYDVQQAEEEGVAKVTCWIASEVGKSFTVNWTDSVVATATATYVCIDGKDMRNGKIIRLGATNERSTARVRGFRVSDEEIRPFIFSAIKLTDDDHYLGNIPEHLGEISVEVHRCTIGQLKTSKWKGGVDLSDKAIHERSKKAIVHKVSAGASTVSRAPRFECHNLSKVVNFIFRYRTIDQLIASDIVPHPQPKKRSAPAEEVEVINISDDSEDEVDTRVAQLKAELAALEAKRARKKIKKEHVVKQEDVKPVIIS